MGPGFPWPPRDCPAQSIGQESSQLQDEETQAGRGPGRRAQEVCLAGQCHSRVSTRAGAGRKAARSQGQGPPGAGHVGHEPTPTGPGCG